MRNDEWVDQHPSQHRSQADAVAHVRAALTGRSGTRWVGVDGYGASGKTTFAGMLQAALDGSIVVHVDDFAKPGVPTWEQLRFLDQVVEPLMAGRTARYQRWDWATDTGREWIVVEPGQIMIIEGVSSTDIRLGIDWDVTLWVDAPVETRLARALARDGEAMRRTWVEEWIPAEDAYVAAQQPQRRVDLVVCGTQ